MFIGRLIFNVKSPETEYTKDLDLALRRWSDKVQEIIDGGFRLDENADVGIKTVTTSATPDEESAVAHGLGRSPIGYAVISKDKAAHIYDGSTSWDATNIYVRSDIASVTTKLLIF